MCGTCVAEYSVVSPSGPGTASMPRGSIAFGISRGWTYRRVTTTSASSSACPVASVSSRQT